jgi:hypothetical protein
MRAFLIFVGLLVLSGCSHETTQNTPPAPELQSLVGQTVTLRGQFELAGKVGPYIHYGEQPVYLVPTLSSGLGPDYARMQGKVVNVTGVLHFYHATPVATNDSIARPVDYFYFDAGTAKVSGE